MMQPEYFFCGVGGSGMAPLALIVQARGAKVEGSDRARDQGRSAAKFAWLGSQGVTLHPQDGSGITRASQTVVCSAAVEETVPDVQAARRAGAPVILRAQLLAELFNAAEVRVGVAGTSGKSTVTAMLAWILHQAGRAPTVMNGAEMRPFITPDAPFASTVIGGPELFVSEVDESDGSIALYAPTVAVVNNIALDHKSMDELRELFGSFVAKAKVAVLNLDNEETAALAHALRPPLPSSAGEVAPGLAPGAGGATDGEGANASSRPPARRACPPAELGGGAEPAVFTYALTDPTADLHAADLTPAPDGIAFTLHAAGQLPRPIRLRVPGRHNVANALAALAAASACGVPLAGAADALESFTGVRRRLEVVGTANGVTVIDDFAHNPDKLTATLETLHAFPGRLLLMFQPHGYGPIAKMRAEFARTFADHMNPDDILLMPEPVYHGGTVDRSVSSADLAADIMAIGRRAEALPDRAACATRLLTLARPGDRVVVMGARDDTLSVFAEEVLAGLGAH